LTQSAVHQARERGREREESRRVREREKEGIGPHLPRLGGGEFKVTAAPGYAQPVPTTTTSIDEMTTRKFTGRRGAAAALTRSQCPSQLMPSESAPKAP
jgi:hypothetical protein